MLNTTILAKQAKRASEKLLILSAQEKKAALLELAELFKKKSNEILKANAKDVRKAKIQKLDNAFIDRLILTEQRVKEQVEAVRKIAKLKDLIGEILEKRVLENGIRLEKIRVPLGVIFVIYESRPNVTMDAIALCLKSSNAVILKGGSEAQSTNAVLVKLAKESLTKFGVNEAIQFVDISDRRAIKKLLKLDQYIDVVIPRGGYNLVKTVLENSAIPVLSHAEGINHIFVDKEADLEIAEKICLNAKTNRPGTCNAVDVLLVHRDIAERFLKSFAQRLEKARVKIKGDTEARKIIQAKKAKVQDWKTEFLNLVLAIKVVANIDEAIEFINHYGSGHSEGIVSKNKTTNKKFIKRVDSAAIFVNCSTRLHDGGIFGIGAEMGIATGKLHARGPVGLKELTTYKWILKGNGQVRT